MILSLPSRHTIVHWFSVRQLARYKLKRSKCCMLLISYQYRYWCYPLFSFPLFKLCQVSSSLPQLGIEQTTVDSGFATRSNSATPLQPIPVNGVRPSSGRRPDGSDRMEVIYYVSAAATSGRLCFAHFHLLSIPTSWSRVGNVLEGLPVFLFPDG